jgi:hypothetical protein
MASVNIPIISEFDAKGTQKAIKEFQSLEGASAKAQFAIKKAAIPAAAAIAGLATAIVPAISAASDLEESMSKVSVIFGDGAEAITEFSKTAAKEIGQSEQAVLDAAGTFGSFGKIAGLSGKDLSNFSNDFTTLASDLASFNNTTPEEAINAIGSALRGETEPLRKYNILLNDAALRAEAAALKIYDGSGALTDQQKILAAQSLIYKQSATAQGDFDKTSDGLANTSRTLTAQMDNLQGSIGKALLPAVQAVLPYIAEFATWATNNSSTFLIIAGAIGAIAVTILTLNAAMKVYAAAQMIVNGVVAVFNALLFANPVTLIVLAIVAFIAILTALYFKFDSVRKIVDTVFQGMLKGGKAVFDGLTTYFGAIFNIYKTLFNGIAKLWNGTVGKLAFNIPSWVPVIGGKGFEVPEIPMLADGGIVTGPTLAMIGERGPEAVIPLSGRGGGMGNYTININGGLGSSAEIGTAVVNAIRAFNRQNGPANIAVA